MTFPSFFVIIFLGIKRIVVNMDNTNNVNRNAMNILDERYVRGEISEEEYAHKKEQLRK